MRIDISSLSSTRLTLAPTLPLLSLDVLEIQHDMPSLDDAKKVHPTPTLPLPLPLPLPYHFDSLETLQKSQ